MLPSKAIWRKNKLGFNPPERSWFNEISDQLPEELKNSNILNEICDMKKLSKKLKRMDNNLKWRLYNIAIWEKKFNVKCD